MSSKSGKYDVTGLHPTWHASRGFVEAAHLVGASPCAASGSARANATMRLLRLSGTG